MNDTLEVTADWEFLALLGPIQNTNGPARLMVATPGGQQRVVAVDQAALLRLAYTAIRIAAGNQGIRVQ